MINKSDIISEVVVNNYRTTAVFKKYSIDFCCNGNRTIEDASITKQLDVEVLVSELNNQPTTRERNDNYSSWSPGFLIEYIINEHHNYLRETVPLVEQYADKVARVHGDHEPKLIELYQTFLKFKDAIMPHLEEEETTLFPDIKANKEEVRSQIEAIKADHNVVGDLLRKMSELTNAYVPPAHACNTYRVLFSYLEELENDTHKHVHLENNVLLKKYEETSAV